MTLKPRRVYHNQLILEQLALLLTSFIWTLVFLTPLVLFWTMKDVQATWDVIINDTLPPPAIDLAKWVQPTPTPRPTWTPTPTPQATWTPTSEPSQVDNSQPAQNIVSDINLPNLLPDTPNQDDPTPVPVTISSHLGQGVATLANVIAAPHQLTTTQTITSTKASSTATNLLPTSTPTTVPQQTSLQPTHLYIPAVGIDSEIVPVGWQVVEQYGQRYSIWEVADYAVGWHNTTAKIGDVGNTVLAGHHNINGEIFKNLVNVAVGDEVLIYADNIPHTYLVELKTIVKEKGESLSVRQQNAQWIAPTSDERLTMVTCWPYTNNTHRVIVVAKPINDE